jgi:hypothetical protein
MPGLRHAVAGHRVIDHEDFYVLSH